MRTPRVVRACDLQVGMLVRAPAWVVDYETKRRIPLAEIWPDAPRVLHVQFWDWEEGESELEARDGTGSIDCCVCDYPEHFEVLREGDAVRLAAAFRRAGFSVWALGGGSHAWVRQEGDVARVVTDSDDTSDLPPRFNAGALEGLYRVDEWGEIDTTEPIEYIDHATAVACLARWL